MHQGPALSNRALLILRSAGAEPLLFLLSRGQLGFGFSDAVQRFSVLLFALARFLPLFLAAIELLLCALHIDLLGLERIVRQDGDAVRQNFDEPPAHVVYLVAAFASAMQPHV